MCRVEEYYAVGTASSRTTTLERRGGPTAVVACTHTTRFEWASNQEIRRILVQQQFYLVSMLSSVILSPLNAPLTFPSSSSSSFLPPFRHFMAIPLSRIILIPILDLWHARHSRTNFLGHRYVTTLQIKNNKESPIPIKEEQKSFKLTFNHVQWEKVG